MSLAGTIAVSEIWAKCKAWFGRRLGTATTATTISIQLKNNAGDNLGDAATISAATSTSAGAMTADMYSKLDGIEAGANDYTHPSYTAHSTEQLYKFTNDGTGHVNAATAATAADIVTLLGTTAVNRASADGAGNLFGAAALLDVDTSISSGSTSTDVPTTAAVASFVASQVTGATSFQGVANTNTDISSTAYATGWYWVIGTAGTYVNQTCEVGDMVFAISNKGVSYDASDFTVVQNNIVEMTAAEVDAICV